MHPVTTAPITIDLKTASVPNDAKKVIVYAKVQSGNVPGQDKSGELVVSSTTITGFIERKLSYHVYHQNSWSFNSENMRIPLTPGMTKSIEAKLEGPTISGNFGASVQIVGFTR